MNPVPPTLFARMLPFPVRTDFTGKVAGAVVLAMTLAACAPGIERPDGHEAGWNDNSLWASQRQRELMLQSNWQGKPYKDLMEAFGESVSELDIPSPRSPETFVVIFGVRNSASNCIDAFTLKKVEDSREWVVNDYFCR